MHTYSYNDKLDYYLNTVNGIITINDIVDHYDNLYHNEELPLTLKVIINCTKATFNIKPDDIDGANQSINQAVTKYKFIREAIIVDYPHGTAVAILFEAATNALSNYNFKVFCTEKAALEWLL